MRAALLERVGAKRVMRDILRAATRDAADRSDGRASATLRLIDAALAERDHAAKERGDDPLDDDAIANMLGAMIEQREEVIGRCEASARIEQAEQEQAEIDVIRALLPIPLDDAATREAVAAAIAAAGALKVKDVGKVMAELKARHEGRMDFALAKRIACELLA